MTDEMLYKFLDEDGEPYHGGSGAWSLPTAEGPGEWREVTGPLIPCENGLHLCRETDLLNWVAPVLYEAEYHGERIDVDVPDAGPNGTKVVVRKARLTHRVTTWNERTQRLWACDCAERVLPLYEREHPGDTRPRDAVAVARRFATGEATSGELAAADAEAYAAARAEAYAAARAAYAVARAAARAEAYDAARAAAYAAGYAASAVYTASTAARAAVDAAERQWQLERLLQYLRGEVA